jgi:hypothetical protein
MKDININFKILASSNLNVNEYLALYDIVNNNEISASFDYGLKEVYSLEKKGYVKCTSNGLFLRKKAEKLFSINMEYFDQWLEIYPTRVKKRYRGSRALSPASSNTILGKNLRNKWMRIFKNNLDAQQKAILVLEAYLDDLEKAGDLEYAVEATRWLNEGYHEKYEYLLEDNKPNDYENEDYM